MRIALRLRQLSARSLFSVENASAALWASPPERLACPHDDDRGAGPSLHALRRCRGFAAEASPASQDDEEEQREIGNPRVRPAPQGGRCNFMRSAMRAAMPHPSAASRLLSAAPNSSLVGVFVLDCVGQHLSCSTCSELHAHHGRLACRRMAAVTQQQSTSWFGC